MDLRTIALGVGVVLAGCSSGDSPSSSAGAGAAASGGAGSSAVAAANGGGSGSAAVGGASAGRGGASGGAGSRSISGGAGGRAGVGGSSGSTTAGTGAPPNATGFAAGPTGCEALKLEADAMLAGYAVDRYAWSDGSCARRSAALVQNDASDPGGSRGGYLRELTWQSGSMMRTATGTGAGGWNGWGYVVNHFGDGADTSQKRSGQFRSVFAGAHHAIHEFKVTMSPGGPVDVTVHWLFATGHSAALYAISFDASAAGQDTVNADTRAPYGDLAFEGTSGDIGGVGWGDKYRFVTTGSAAVDVNTAWTYTEPNVVPYVRMWSQNVDAEMGAVQTLSFERQSAGGDYGGGILVSDCWGKTSANKGANCVNDGQTMPKDWLWPFQLNQYELPFTKDSHRLAWGASYGMIGQRSVSVFGKTLSGYPRVSYSVYMIIDAKMGQPTLALAGEVEHTLGAQLSASSGSVTMEGPAGVGRSDTASYLPAGYDPVYGVWRLAAANGAVKASLDPRAGALKAPIFRVSGFSAAAVSSVLVNGTALQDGQYFASVDSAQQELWLTLNGTISGRIDLEIK